MIKRAESLELHGLALQYVRSAESKMRARVANGESYLSTIGNPFMRNGVSASEIGFKIGIPLSGRARTNSARRIVKRLAEMGELVCLGQSRTLAAGSARTETWATPEYAKWLQAQHKKNTQEARSPQGALSEADRSRIDAAQFQTT